MKRNLVYFNFIKFKSQINIYPVKRIDVEDTDLNDISLYKIKITFDVEYIFSKGQI